MTTTSPIALEITLRWLQENNLRAFFFLLQKVKLSILFIGFPDASTPQPFLIAMDASTPIIFLVGIVGIFLNIIVAIAISINTELSKSTSTFMTYLAAADIETLLGIVGPPLLVMMGYQGKLFTIQLHVPFSFILVVGFNISNIMLSFVAFTRWVQFVKPHLKNTFLTPRKQAFTGVALFGLVHLLYAPFFFDYSLFHPFDDNSWFVYDNASYPFFLEMFEEVANHVSLICQACFNGVSLLWVWRMRKQILNPELKKHHKREVKLLIMCVIDWVINTTTVLLYDLTAYIGGEAKWISMLGEKFMIMNHIDLAILYLCFNKRLRQDIVKFVKKLFRCERMISTVTPMNVATPHRHGDDPAQIVQ